MSDQERNKKIVLFEEFGFCYMARIKLGVSDVQRRDLALAGIEGKRLTYRRIGEAGHA